MSKHDPKHGHDDDHDPKDPKVVSRIFRTLVGGLLRLSDHRVALPEQLHVQISFGRPARAGDMPEPGRG